MKKVIAGCIIAIGLMTSGCVGVFTGHKYTFDEAKIIYKVVKSGVTTFMTEEEIKDKGLDKVNDVIITTYKVISGNDAE